MKKTLLFTTILCVSAAYSVAQNLEWAYDFGGTSYHEAALGSALDNSGNLVVTGSFGATVDFDPGSGSTTLTAGGGNAFVAKYSSGGQLLWTRGFLGSGSSQGLDVATDLTGNIYVGGYVFGAADMDPGAGTASVTTDGMAGLVAKFDPNGTLLWYKLIDAANSQKISGIAVDNSGGVYCAGEFYGTVDFDPSSGTVSKTSNGENDMFLLKLSDAGDFQWVNAMGSSSSDLGTNVETDPSGNVIFSGYYDGNMDFDPSAGTYNVTSAGQTYFLSKFTSAGAFVWVAPVGGSNPGAIYDVAVDTQGEIYAAGQFTGTTDFDSGTGVHNMVSAGYNDCFIYKLDGNGAFQWSQRIGGTEAEFAYGVDVDAQKNVYLTGFIFGSANYSDGSNTVTITGNGLYDIFLARLSSAGEFLWVDHFGGTDYELASSVSVRNGDIYITGSINSSTDFDPGTGIVTVSPPAGNSQDFFLAKYNQSALSLDMFAAGEWKVYPNPATEMITIQSGKGGGTLRISDISGKLISTGTLEEMQQIDISSLNAGMYLFEVCSASSSGTIRVVKN